MTKCYLKGYHNENVEPIVSMSRKIRLIMTMCKFKMSITKMLEACLPFGDNGYVKKFLREARP